LSATEINNPRAQGRVMPSRRPYGAWSALANLLHDEAIAAATNKRSGTGRLGFAFALAERSKNM
jgi:hypothetical protein